MKKLFLAACMVLGLTCLAGAQTTHPAKNKTAVADTTRKAGPLKKDGTPDKRYKANKADTAKAAPAGPLKKDGTPDKRYKANKKS